MNMLVVKSIGNKRTQEEMRQRLGLQRKRNRFSLILKREGEYVRSNYFRMGSLFLNQSGHMLRMAKLWRKGCMKTSNPRL